MWTFTQDTLKIEEDENVFLYKCQIYVIVIAVVIKIKVSINIYLICPSFSSSSSHKSKAFLSYVYCSTIILKKRPIMSKLM